ncbi:MAG: phosphoribosyl-AMP cyclohydrolase [Bacteroidetes bacterium ADurb.Bin145]|jgi:phosphoribosyl-AMP cyclohydrolase|nr:MAG: phosphoribosyl-AMP cyclohydrolase [Bacteroidetes bacterium ADurb.Bin145]
MGDGNDSMITIKFDEKGLVPVIAQDFTTKDVLMLAYANKEAVDLTRSTGYAHYFSRSRNKLWKKGEESGHMQKVHEILVDCDEDAVIYLVDQLTAACHTGYRSCFYRRLDGTVSGERMFDPEEVYRKKE